MRKKNQITEIINIFDFQKINSVMKFLDIKWPLKGGDRVPTVEELKSTALLCLASVSESEDATANHTLCGFEASKEEEILQLSFILERASPLSPLLNVSKNYDLGN